MATDDAQLSLVSLEDTLRSYERILTLHLERLSTWTYLPDERTDWALEQLLQDIGAASLALRSLRAEASVPF